ncbi:MAG: endonuclease [Cytophagales bacterium]|nr:endonuclease [Cytophagales bacterium]
MRKLLRIAVCLLFLSAGIRAQSDDAQRKRGEPEKAHAVQRASGYNYLMPVVGNDGRISVTQTPKDYVVTASQHMVSVAYDIANGQALNLRDYYATAENLSGSALRDELRRIAAEDHQPKTYDVVWSICEEGDEYPGSPSQVWLLYTQKGVLKTSRPSGWNREHVWAKSHGDFGNTVGRGTDGHHLRAADPAENSKRSHYDFAENGGYYPPKSSRGDVARSIFYMAMRYGMTVDNQLIGGVGKKPRHGKLDDLLQWHNDDPVDPYEIRRNNVVYKYQQNRNPFIDHPELVELVFGDNTSAAWDGGVVYGDDTNLSPLKVDRSMLKDFPSVVFGQTSPEQYFEVFGQGLASEVAVQAPDHFELSPQPGGIFSSSLTLNTDQNNSLARTKVYIRFRPEAQDLEEVVAYVQLSSGESANRVRVNAYGGVKPTDVFAEDFEEETTGWQILSLQGKNVWNVRNFSSNKFMEMRGYQGDAAELDWLLSPEINLGGYRSVKLEFSSQDGYYTHDGLTCYVMEGWQTGDDPEQTQKTLLQPQLASGTTQGYGTWTYSGELSLSAWSGQIRLAFRYEGGNPGQTGTFRIDNVWISGKAATGTTPQQISFPEPQPKTYGDEPFALQASSDSGLEVQFTSGNPALATVSGNQLTIRRAGTVALTASQPGNAQYAPAVPVTRSLVIEKAPLTVTAQDAEKVQGSPDPDFTVEYSGFVYDDTEVDLEGELVFTVLDGTVIRPSGLSSPNYSTVFVDGTLTILDNPNLINVEDEPVARLWPNPASDIVHIDSGAESGQMLTICNMLGKKVLQTQFSDQNQVRVNHLPEGVYIVILKGKQQEKVFKLVISR